MDFEHRSAPARRGIQVALLSSFMILVVATASALPGRSHQIRARLSGHITVPAPASFVWVGTTGAGLQQQHVVELRASATARVTKVLGTFGESFTNNGLALSPDGRNVYVTLIPPGTRWTSLLLEQVAVSDNKRTFVADGEQPAVSPDSRRLAYTARGSAHAEKVAVRDLASGVTRSINIAGLIGAGGDLLLSSVTWLADGSDLAVVPSGVAIAATGSRRTSPPPPAPCHALAGSSCLVIVHVTGAGRPLTARRFILPRIERVEALSADAAGRGSLLLADDGFKNGAVIDRISLTGSAVRIQKLLSISRGLALTFDPAGRQLLYLTNTPSPPHTDLTTVTLWKATISSGQLIQRRRLIRNPQLEAVAW